MRFKSFVARVRPHRASRISRDTNPPPASVPGEANERFASGVNTPHCDAADVEMVPETVNERDVPLPKKCHCLGTRTSLEACIVCDILDERVSRCSGSNCPVWFHWECLNPDLGSSCSEDLAKTYCPYCWYKVVEMRHRSAREKVIEARKDVLKYLSKETKSKHHSEKKDVSSSDDDGSREEGMPLTEDVEEDEDEEATKDQTSGDTDARGKGDVSRCLSVQESSSGKEQDQIQQNERPRRRRQLILNDSDSDISSDDSSNERNGEHVSEEMAQVVTTPSGTMKNQQRKHGAKTEVAKSKTVRDISPFKSDQRKRLYWTPEEEEMLKVGVEKFSAEAKKNMPWRKILEMGEEVFHETRTPADLKDKWRNGIGARVKNTN